MRALDAIVIHCADTPAEMDIGAAEIRRWHIEGNGWKDIGYHYVIRRDGRVERGRSVELSGAHVAGHNAQTIGICLVGGRGPDKRPLSNFTHAQWNALDELVRALRLKYGDLAVKGHRDYDASKACPCFDVTAWWNK